MSEDRPVRVAVVGGAGTWGRFYLRAYAAHPGCEVIALVDRAKDRRQAFADRYGVPATFDDLEELLRREVPEVVSAILPVARSHPAVLACAEAGVRVVSIEKPIAAQLSKADEMIRVCRERGTALGCGTSHWQLPYQAEVADWVRQGHIGALTGAAIPGGLPTEVSGGGCANLIVLGHLTGMEVEWAEGWTLPPVGSYASPEAEAPHEVDCPAYGRLGLSGGIVCEIAEPEPDRPVPCTVSVTGERGRAFLASPRPVLLQGAGARQSPVFPEFLDGGPRKDAFTLVIERLLKAAREGGEVACSGQDYLHVLEVALAMTLSAARDHERVHLPLEDRSLRLFPHPYRMYGGDVAGWRSIGYQGPPGLPEA